jgi:hypothetical protein
MRFPVWCCVLGDLQAAAAVKQQQVVLKRALGNTQQGSGIFPAGMPSPAPAAAAASSAASTQHTTLPGAAAVSPGTRFEAARAAATTASSSSQLAQACAHTGAAASSRGGSRGSSQKLQPLGQKLAARIVETCVDQVFAAKAAPNMPDGSFNPVLSLQQAADFEAAGEAADLDRRLERGLVSVCVLVLHGGMHVLSSRAGSGSSCRTLRWDLRAFCAV